MWKPLKRRTMRVLLSVSTLLAMPILSTGWADSQHKGHAGQGPVYISMEALHAAGGTPPGWQFTLPGGDPETGREVFVTLQCYTCHNIAGETFPAYPPRSQEMGPDLTGMGAHHPAAYFAESIINPNAVIVTGKGYTGKDGLSRMPAYNHDLTIEQLIDLVAYLRSLREPMPHTTHDATGHMPHPTMEHQHEGGGHGMHPHVK